MELSWSTFVLEIINFLVLVWILKRFLYKPVLDVIAARRKSIEDKLDEAHTIETEAESLKGQYTSRLSAWETEKHQAREALDRELKQERGRRLSELQTELAEEQQKTSVAAERKQAERQRAIERQALLQGAAFATRMLEQAAGPALEVSLLNLLIDDLEGLPAEQLGRLREECSGMSEAIDVSSAFVLSETQRERLVTALRVVVGDSADFRFRQDQELVSGLRIVIGSWVLAANVRDELTGFTEFAHARN